jgi:hypothetical protein
MVISALIVILEGLEAVLGRIYLRVSVMDIDQLI